jgi:hypothetical protein
MIFLHWRSAWKKYVNSWQIRAPDSPFWRRFLPVWLAGVLGVSTLTLQPILAEMLAQSNALAESPRWVLSLVLLLNPLLLVTLLCVAGAAAAHRVGLTSILAGTAVAERSLRPWLNAVAAGLVLGPLLIAIDLVWAPFIGPEWQAFLSASTEQSSWRSLVLGVGYGGLAEEVMMRWGLMSLLALALVKMSGRRGGPSPSLRVYVVAGLLSALVFAAGHLPALAQVFEPTGMLVARTLVLNTIAGLLYAWLFWRRCLEAAMLGHAATHVGFALARSVL